MMTPKTMTGSNQIFVQNYKTGGTISGLYIYDNIFKYPSGNSIFLWSCSQSFIYNNTFCGSNQVLSEGTQGFISLSNASTATKIKNNIFYTDLNYETNGQGKCIHVYPDTDPAQVEADYNIYYRVNNQRVIIIGSSTFYRMNDISKVRSILRWEAHGKFIDPLFLSPDDYHLSPGSPAIHAGTGITWAKTDFEGKTWSASPSIGAYESGEAPNTPFSNTTNSNYEQYFRIVFDLV